MCCVGVRVCVHVHVHMHVRVYKSVLCVCVCVCVCPHMHVCINVRAYDKGYVVKILAACEQIYVRKCYYIQMLTSDLQMCISPG